MSEVKFYKCIGEMEQRSRQGSTEPFFRWVDAIDFDAQRLRADTAEAERNQLLNDPNNVFKKMCDMALKQRDEAMSKLAAAEQRIAEQHELLFEVQKAARKQAWAHGYPTLFAKIDAALNPNPEAESHE